MEDAACAAIEIGLPTQSNSSSRSLADDHEPPGHANGDARSHHLLHDTVTFGKYRGQPVSVLLGDAGYCCWLLKEEWFRSEHARLYQVIRERKQVSRLRRDFDNL